MSSVSILNPYPNLFIKQSNKGCLRTFCGCDAQDEFHIATIENENADKFYAKEDSGCCCRIFCPFVHPFTVNFSSGATTTGPLVAIYRRPLKCVPGICKCCCYQEIMAFDGAFNTPIGSISETCYFCVPQYNVKNQSNDIRYHIAVPTCFICCPNYCAEGCCLVPFYVYPNGDMTHHVGKIVRRWGSCWSQCFGVPKYSSEFPAGSSAEDKALLMGGSFLLNEIYFKRHCLCF